jgi:hypothetical protein
MKIIKEIFNQTLKENGKWSIKRFGGVSGFYVAVLYAFTPLLKPEFIVLEFVFWGFITFAGTALGLTLLNKKKQDEN